MNPFLWKRCQKQLYLLKACLVMSHCLTMYHYIYIYVIDSSNQVGSSNVTEKGGSKYGVHQGNGTIWRMYHFCLFFEIYIYIILYSIYIYKILDSRIYIYKRICMYIYIKIFQHLYFWYQLIDVRLYIYFFWKYDIYIFQYLNDIYIYIFIYWSNSGLQTQVSIDLQHVFSVEINEKKRAYIQKAHPNVCHLFACVSVFSKKKGWCYTCNKEHAVTSSMLGVDMYLIGPSCKDLSTLLFICKYKYKYFKICIYFSHIICPFVFKFIYSFYTHIYIYKFNSVHVCVFVFQRQFVSKRTYFR